MPDSLRFSHHSREVSAAAVELTRVTVTVRCAVEELKLAVKHLIISRMVLTADGTSSLGGQLRRNCFVCGLVHGWSEQSDGW